MQNSGQYSVQINTPSFPLALYATLEKIAKEKKVSLAWIVHDATERYVAEQGV